MNSFMDREKVPSEYEANTEILMQVPLFSSAPLESIKILAYLCTRVLFRPGEYVFHAGEIAEFACCIIDGTATMTLGGGGEERVLRKYQGGDFLGGLSLLAEVRHLFSLKAESELRCLVITREKFTGVLEQFPGLSRNIIEAGIAAVYDWEKRLLRVAEEEHPECLQALGVTMV